MMSPTFARTLNRLIFGNRPGQRRRTNRPWLEALEARLAPSVTLSISNPAPFPKPDSGQFMGMFVVTRSGDLGPAVQVDYQTQDGTGANGAHAGTDYTATVGTLNFASNQMMATIAVPVLGNNIFQSDRTFTVSLSNPRSNAFGFALQQTFATGTNPRFLVVGDFNGDGKPDLAIANFYGNTVSVLLNTTPVGATTPSFAQQQTFATGRGPHSIAVGDFNGDGKPDLTVVNEFDNTASVLLNTTPTGSANASFAPQQTFAVGDRPFKVAVGDFNGDGKSDLAVANFTSATVSVLLNTTPTGATTPSFAPQQTFATGSGANFVAVADFNGDGKPDLAVDNEGPNTVSVRLNTTPAGSATVSFAPQLILPTSSYPVFIAVGDLNGDGKPDLAVDDQPSNIVSVALNTTASGATTPSFTPQRTFPVGGGSASIAVGDFNSDGKLDLAVTNDHDGTLSVLLNSTPLGATTPSFTSQQTFATGIAPAQGVVGDFNGDGKPDLAVANDGSNTVSVLLNDSAGPIALNGSPATGTISSGPEAPAAVAVVADTTPQSAVVNTPFATPLAVDVRNAAGHLVQNVSVTFSAPGGGSSGRFGSNTSATVVTNASGRATAPTFTANTIAGSFIVMAQAAGGSSPSTSFSLTNTPAAASTLIVAGFPSPVTAGTAGNFTVTAQDPYGNTATGYTGRVHFTSGDAQAALPDDYTFQAADNGRHLFGAVLKTAGTQALTATDSGTPGLTGTQAGIVVQPAAAARLDLSAPARVFPNAPFAVTVIVRDPFNNVATGYTSTVRFRSTDPLAGLTGDYTFMPGDAGQHTFSMTLGTAGRQTIVARDTAQRALRGHVPIRVTPQRFYPAEDFPVGANPQAVAVGDFNGDGIPDLAVANGDDDTVSILLGQGDGTFVNAGTLATDLYPLAVVATDLAGDGIEDLVVVNRDSSTLTVYLGNGDSTFQPGRVYAVGLFPSAVAVADVTGDGVPDLVVADTADAGVDVLLGNGDGTFQTPIYSAVGGFPVALAVADVNGDGLADVVTANPGSNTISVLLGNGDGSFRLDSQRIYRVGTGPVGVAAADLTGDGIPDLAVANNGSNTVSVLLGNGDGSFQPARSFAAGAGPTAIVATDVNGDGVPDLAVANQNDNTVSVLVGDGDGSFRSAVNFGVSAGPAALAAADFNGDQATDLVTADSEANTVSVLLNAGDWPTQPPGRPRLDRDKPGAGLLLSATPEQLVTPFPFARPSSPPVLKVAMTGAAGLEPNDMDRMHLAESRGSRLVAVLRLRWMDQAALLVWDEVFTALDKA